MVERALKRFGGKFYLARLLPSWEHRGEESFNCGKIQILLHINIRCSLHAFNVITYE